MRSGVDWVFGNLELVEKLGLPAHLFPKLQKPGTVIGEYQGIKAMLCATHDTASAVEGILAVADAAVAPPRSAGRLDRSVAPARSSLRGPRSPTSPPAPGAF